MRQALQPYAAAAREATRTLARGLAASRSQWNDTTRREFDQRHLDALTAASMTVAQELDSYAQELAAALASISRA